MKKPAGNIHGPLPDQINELFLHAFIEGSRDFIFFIDTNYRYIRFNRAHEAVMARVYGVKISPGMDLLDCITLEETRATTKSYLDQVLKTGEKVLAERFLIDAEQQHRYYEVAYIPVRDKNGTVIGIAVTAHDITERKSTSALATTSETRYRELFDHISSCVAVYEAADNGSDFIIRDFNRAACAIEKVKREDVVGRSVREVFPGVENFGIFKVFQRVWQTGQPDDFPIAQYKDDRISGWRENYIYKLPSGEVVAVYSDVTERKQTQEKLELTNERLELALKGADLGLYDGNLKTGELYINDQYMNMLGYEAGETDFNLDAYFKLVHPDDVTALLNRLDESFRDRNSGMLNLEYRMLHRSGSWIWIMDRFHVAEWDSDGNPIRVAGTHHDITQEKLAAEALKESERAYRDIFETAPIGILNSTLDGKLLSVNVALSRMLGYNNTEELVDSVNKVGIAQAIYADPVQRSEIMQDIKRQTGWPQYEVDIKGKNGNIITCRMQVRKVYKNNSDVIDHFEAFIEDITARKQALAALERQREEYRTIFDAVPAAVAYVDGKGTFMRVNQPAAAVLGYTPSQMVGKNLSDVFPPDEAAIFKSMHSEVFTSGIPLTGSINSYTTRTGEVKWAQNDVLPYFDSKGKIIGTIVFSEDVTDRMKAEHGLKLSYEALQKSLQGAVEAIAKIVELRDPYTAGHQARVAELAVAIAEEMGLSEEHINYMRMAARLHDVGKIYVPSDILSKPGKLTKIEYEIIKTHAQGSYDILKSIDFPGPVAQIALQHHERLNGSGYPHGTSGDDIILEARILSVADVVEAMVSYRPYRPSLGLDKALEEIRLGRDNLYDTGAVDACIILFEEKNFTFAVQRAF